MFLNCYCFATYEYKVRVNLVQKHGCYYKQKNPGKAILLVSNKMIFKISIINYVTEYSGITGTWKYNKNLYFNNLKPQNIALIFVENWGNSI